LWNAAKFIIRYESSWERKPVAPATPGTPTTEEGRGPDLASRWIVSRLAATVDEVNRNLAGYRFNDAANGIYHFLWHEFCDWYIELTKPVLYREGESGEKSAVVGCLFFVLETSLRLLHPFMPFVTEEIGKSVFGSSSVMLSPYPEGLPAFPDAERKMAYLLNAVTGIRSIRGELNISPSLEMTAAVRTLAPEVEEVLTENLESIKKMTRCSEIRVGAEVERLRGAAVAVQNGVEIYVPIEGLLDVQAEIRRLDKEMAKLEESLAFLDRKLMNEDFLKNAPKNVLEKDRAKFEELKGKKGKIEENIRLLETIGGKEG
ncbi:MAG: class I tRNA ligase family protein, partial [Thermodesulfovibrionales bacterium]